MRPAWSPFVAHPENLLTLHSLGRLYGQRPSAFLGLNDPWLAYQIDVAAAQAGSKPNEAKKFAPMAALTKGKKLRKVQIPKSGIW